MTSPSIEDRIASVVREALASLKLEIVEHVVAALRVNAKGPEREWLTTTEVADELEVTRATVRAWVKAGRLRAAPGTRYLRIHRDELSRFMAGAGGADDGKVESLVSRLRKTR